MTTPDPSAGATTGPIRPYVNPVSPAAQFLAGLDWTLPIVWLDDTGILRFDDGRFAKLHLCAAPGRVAVAGEVAAIAVNVYSPTHGRLDGKAFVFDDYLPAGLDYRLDGRADHPARRGGACFKVVTYVGWKWHIAIPRETRPLTHAVEAYLGLYDVPGGVGA